MYEAKNGREISVFAFYERAWAGMVPAGPGFMDRAGGGPPENVARPVRNVADDFELWTLVIQDVGWFGG